MNFLSDHFVHIHHNQAVIEQQPGARLDIADQFLIGQADTLIRTFIQVQSAINNELLSDFQHRFARFELSDTDFRPLHVGQNADADAVTFGGCAHVFRARPVLFR